MSFRRLVVYLLIGLVFFLTSCQKEAVSRGLLEDIPVLLVHFGEASYEVKHGGYRIERKQGGSMMVEMTDAASPGQIAEGFDPFLLPAGSRLELEFQTDLEGELEAYRWDDQGVIGRLSIEDGWLVLPDESGEVIVELLATWKNAEASYTFVVELES